MLSDGAEGEQRALERGTILGGEMLFCKIRVGQEQYMDIGLCSWAARIRNTVISGDWRLSHDHDGTSEPKKALEACRFVTASLTGPLSLAASVAESR